MLWLWQFTWLLLDITGLLLNKMQSPRLFTAARNSEMQRSSGHARNYGCGQRMSQVAHSQSTLRKLSVEGDILCCLTGGSVLMQPHPSCSWLSVHLSLRRHKPEAGFRLSQAHIVPNSGPMHDGTRRRAGAYQCLFRLRVILGRISRHAARSKDHLAGKCVSPALPGSFVYCADYKYAHLVVIGADRWVITSGFPILSRAHLRRVRPPRCRFRPPL